MLELSDFCQIELEILKNMSATGIYQCIRNASFLCPLLCHLMSCIFAISYIIFAYHVACAALQKV